MKKTLQILCTSLLLALALSACSASHNQAWEEPFDTGTAWVLNSDAAADVEIADGVLRITIHDPEVIAWSSTTERTFSNFRVSVEATHVSGPLDNEFGLLLRMDGDKRFYAFSASSDGYVRVALYDNGTWTLPGSDWSPSAAIKQGETATNLLEVEARGADFIFRINGQQVATLKDTTLKSGALGVYAGSFSEGEVVMSFDNLKVEPLK